MVTEVVLNFCTEVVPNFYTEVEPNFHTEVVLDFCTDESRILRHACNVCFLAIAEPVFSVRKFCHFAALSILVDLQTISMIMLEADSQCEKYRPNSLETTGATMVV